MVAIRNDWKSFTGEGVIKNKIKNGERPLLANPEGDINAVWVCAATLRFTPGVAFSAAVISIVSSTIAFSSSFLLR